MQNWALRDSLYTVRHATGGNFDHCAMNTQPAGAQSDLGRVSQYAILGPSAVN